MHNLSQFQQLCDSASPIPVRVWIFYSQPLYHFFNNFITPKPLPTDGIYEGSKEVEIWASKPWAVWWVGKNSQFEFCNGFLCFKACVFCDVVLEVFRTIFARANSPKRLLQHFKSLNVHIIVNGLITWHIYWNHPFFIPPLQIVACWSGSLKLLLPSRSWMIAVYWMSFCLRLKMMDPCFIPSGDPWQRAFTISLITGEQILTHFFPHSAVIVG